MDQFGITAVSLTSRVTVEVFRWSILEVGTERVESRSQV